MRYHPSILPFLRSSVARHAGIVLTGNLASALLRFAVCMMLASTFTKDDYAYLMIFVAVMDLASAFGDSGLNATMVRFVALHREENCGPIVRQVFSIRITIWAIVAAVALAGAAGFFAIQRIEPDYRWIYSAALVAGLLLSFNGHGMAVMQGRQRFVAFAVLAMSINIVRTVSVGGALKWGVHDPATLYKAFFIVPLAAAPLSAGLIMVTLRGLRRLPAVEASYGELLRFTAPTGAIIAIAMLLQKLDILMLKAMSTDAVVADYGAAYMLAFVFPLITRSLFTVLLPKVAALKSARALRDYRRRVLTLYPALLGATAIGTVVGPWVLEFILGDKYASAIPILRMLILGFGIHLIFNPLGVILYAIERHFYIPLIHLIQLPILVSLNLLLIPALGGIGATISALVIRVLGVAAMVVLTQKAIQNKARQEHERAQETTV